MGLIQRRSHIKKLGRHLSAIHQILEAIREDESYFPNPAEFLEFVVARNLLHQRGKDIISLEPLLWKRIDGWRNTPWTKWEKLWRGFWAAVGTWTACLLAIVTSFTGWLVGQLPHEWFWPASAVLACLIVAIAAFRCGRGG